MATKKKPASKPVKAKKASNSSSKKKAPAKKAKADNKSKTKATPAKKVKTAKTVPAKKVASKNDKTVKKTQSKNVKKAEPAKKAAPAKKVAAPAKSSSAKQAPAKKTIPVKKVVVAAPKAAEKKPVAAPAKPASQPVAAKPHKASKKPTKTIVQTKTLTSQPSRPAPSPAARIIKEEKKPQVIIAHRKLENKSKHKEESGPTMINYQPEYNRSILDEPQEQQGPVYRYSDEELNEFRELIQKRLEDARKELLYLQGLITRKDEAGTEDTENRYMNMEDGSGAMEREQLAQLASRQIQFINHLEKALIRIENKTYGICRVTGKLIDKARLRAVPHATLSIEAKKMMSKQNTQQ